MNEIYYDWLYREVFRIIGNSTPVKGDCGVVCKKACCNGDKETGMLLFPHEKTNLNVIEKNERRLAVCDGTCKRNERPLACRLFPFFPIADENGRIKAQLDFRAAAVCPLVIHSKDVVFSRRFLFRVKKAGELLLSDPECAEHLKEISKEISQEKKLYMMITKR